MGGAVAVFGEAADEVVGERDGAARGEL